MGKLIFYEFKKLWNKTTLLAICMLVMFIAIMSGIYYVYYENAIITSSGEKVGGIGSYWVLKKESSELEGEVNQKYLDNFVQKFESSIENKKFSERFGMDFMRFNVASYLLNFPADLDKTSNFSMRFDYDYLKSQDEFYKQYKKGIKKVIRKEQNTMKKRNDFRWYIYTDEQLKAIDKKIDSLKEPFKVSYYQGIEKIIIDFVMQFWVLLVTIGFILSGIFSRDSRNGIDEIGLASAYGRKKNMNSKIIAGNIFSTIVYFIFVATLFILNGAFASLSGLDMSVQVMMQTCLYNMSVGTAMLIIVFMGLLGTIVIANLIMLVSISTKYVKLSAMSSIAIILILVELSKTTNMLQLHLNPVHFSTMIGPHTPIFIGNIMLPYFVISIFIASVYLVIIRIATTIQYKKYSLKG